MTVNDEATWATENEDELIEKYKGAYLVILNHKVIFEADDFEKAYRWAHKHEHLGKCCIRQAIKQPINVVPSVFGPGPDPRMEVWSTQFYQHERLPRPVGCGKKQVKRKSKRKRK